MKFTLNIKILITLTFLVTVVISLYSYKGLSKCYEEEPFNTKKTFKQEGINADVENDIWLKDVISKLKTINNFGAEEFKIPAISHQIYVTSLKNPKPIKPMNIRTVIKNVILLNKFHDNWKHYFWTNNPDIIPQEIKDLKNLEIKLIDTLTSNSLEKEIVKVLYQGEMGKSFFVQACDMIRLIILQQYGGIYHDLDYEIYDSQGLLALMSKFHFFSGWELPNTLIGNAFIATVPNHPIINKAISLVKRNLSTNILTRLRLPFYIRKPCSQHRSVVFNTGPYPLTIAYYKLANKNNSYVDIALPSGVLFNIDYARSINTDSKCYKPSKTSSRVFEFHGIRLETIGSDLLCGEW